MCHNLDNQWQQIQYVKRCHCSKQMFIKREFKAWKDATRDCETLGCCLKMCFFHVVGEDIQIVIASFDLN